jgi:NTP pyrophosphatase (non-canonical NTP hydrolase)
MNYELCDYILMAGKNAAMGKMTQEKNLLKPDMRLSSFSDLYHRLVEEVSELEVEILKVITQNPPPPDLLQAILDETGDVIAFASGIAAKAQQEAAKRNDRQPPLLDDWGGAGNNVCLD